MRLLKQCLFWASWVKSTPLLGAKYLKRPAIRFVGLASGTLWKNWGFHVKGKADLVKFIDLLKWSRLNGLKRQPKFLEVGEV